MNKIIDGTKYFQNSKEFQDKKLEQQVINIANGIYNHDENDDLKNYQVEISQNKKEWTELSRKKINDLHLFNPYIKDNFKKMSALEIYRAYSEELKHLANQMEMPEEEFVQNAEKIKLKMIEEFEAKGILPVYYSDFVVRFDEDFSLLSEVHSRLNSKYTFQTVITKNGEDLSYKMENKNTPDEIIQTTKEKIAECTELGIPKEDIASVIFTGFENFISEHIADVSPDSLISCLDSLDIEGTKLADIVPDYKKQLFNMAKRTMRIYSKLQEYEADSEYFTKKLSKFLALKEFLLWYKSNKNAFPNEINSFINNLMQKYTLDENSYLTKILSKKTLLMNNKVFNPFVVSVLERKSINGTIQTDEIEDSLTLGLIGINDAIRLLENMESDIKPEVLKLEMSSDDRLFSFSEESMMKRAFITIDLQKGYITLSEAEKRLKDLTDSIRKYLGNKK